MNKVKIRLDILLYISCRLLVFHGKIVNKCHVRLQTSDDVKQMGAKFSSYAIVFYICTVAVYI